MSGRIEINYNEIYSITASLRSRLEANVKDMEASYSQIQSSLGTMDGATNATLMEAMEQNKQKAHVSAEILDKLLYFIQSTTQQAQLDDQEKSIFIESSATNAIQNAN